ncbi:hypothetical protein DM01DRAFT_128463 [Hesseltinella vesiculosa]|uniref:Uncharacterized protein n=1 Tax=Hesseltinella vesiculosa TaxID=101127 RepID=A0A1X2GEL3_9FUNG|nr:hypothetical protein DM01DRAFT_128463 [Hesseltinella vesiculosa]
MKPVPSIHPTYSSRSIHRHPPLISKTMSAIYGTQKNVCSHSNCTKTIRIDNTTGYCKLHNRISRNERVNSQDASEQMCTYDGCDKPLRLDNKSGYCYSHRGTNLAREPGTDLTNSTMDPPEQVKWPMILCSYCNEIPVNALTNEKRRCQNCSKTLKASGEGIKRQTGDIAPFSFETGANHAFSVWHVAP